MESQFFQGNEITDRLKEICTDHGGKIDEVSSEEGYAKLVCLFDEDAPFSAQKKFLEEAARFVFEKYERDGKIGSVHAIATKEFSNGDKEIIAFRASKDSWEGRHGNRETTLEARIDGRYEMSFKKKNINRYLKNKLIDSVRENKDLPGAGGGAIYIWEERRNGNVCRIATPWYTVESWDDKISLDLTSYCIEGEDPSSMHSAQEILSVLERGIEEYRKWRDEYLKFTDKIIKSFRGSVIGRKSFIVE
ncbi:MAG: hypothetical protein DRN78_00170 [Thermoproteota archaeon]|nr:MAG: hypothetical protein DRN78_00170 [Candidatus Korarchaeota archaeon]